MPLIERFEPRELGPKPWGSELLIAQTETYIGKVLVMHAGHRGGLQYHRVKDETFYLVSGHAVVTSDDGAGLVMRTMHEGQSYHIPPGAVHQVEAVTECVFFEVSTPVFEDRVRVEHLYGLPETGGLPTSR